MTLTGWQVLLGGTEDQEIKIFLKNGQTNKKLNCQVANFWKVLITQIQSSLLKFNFYQVIFFYVKPIHILHLKKYVKLKPTYNTQ